MSWNHMRVTVFSSSLLSCLRLYLILGLVAQGAWADSFTIPSSWKNITSSYTRGQRIDLAQAAIDQLTKSSVDGGDGVYNGFVDSSRIMSAFARKDFIAGETKNSHAVTAGLLAISGFLNSQGGLDGFTTTGQVVYGIALVDAFRAYNDSEYLEQAKDIWNHISVNQITEQEAAVGTKNNTAIARTCNGGSVAGGILDSDSKPLLIASAGTSGFLILSAHLAQTPSTDAKYLQAARLAASFIEGVLRSSSGLQSGCLTTEVAIDGSTTTCAVTDSKPAMDCSMMYYEGASVLADMLGDANMAQHIVNSVSALLQSPKFSGDGILNDDAVAPGGFPPSDNFVADLFGFTNYMYEPWARNTNNTGFTHMMESFMNVQVNALAQFAKDSAFPADWHGPASSAVTLYSSSAAISALASGIGPLPFVPSNTTTTTTGSTTSSTGATATSSDVDANLQHGMSKGVIVGLAVAIPLLLLAVSLLSLFLFRRRRRNQRMSVLSTSLPPTEPFTTLCPNDTTVFTSPGTRLGDDLSRSTDVENKTYMTWGNQHPLSSITAGTAAATLNPRPRKGSAQTAVTGSSGPLSEKQRTSELTSPSTVSTSPLTPRRNAEASGTTVEAALAQQLEQLGPTPQLLGALQMLISRLNADGVAGAGEVDSELPRYEERRV